MHNHLFDHNELDSKSEGGAGAPPPSFLHGCSSNLRSSRKHFEGKRILILFISSAMLALQLYPFIFIPLWEEGVCLAVGVNHRQIHAVCYAEHLSIDFSATTDKQFALASFSRKADGVGNRVRDEAAF